MKTTKAASHTASKTSTASQPAPSPPDAAANAAAQPSAVYLQKVVECGALLDQVLGLFPSDVDLTPLARRRSFKLRKGGDKIIPILAQAAREMNISISIAPIEPMLHDLAEAQALVPLQAKVATLDKRIRDHVMVSEGAAWATGTALYAVLRRLSKGNGKLAALLAPTEEFFGYRHPSVRKEHPKTRKGKDALKLHAQQHGSAPSQTPITEPPAGNTNGASTNGAPLTNGAPPPNGLAAH